MYKYIFSFSLFFALVTSALTAQIDLILPADIVVCNSQSVVLSPTVLSGGDGNYTFSWSPTEGLSDPTIENPTASPATSTEYTLTVMDGSGLQVMASTIITVSSEITLTSDILNLFCNSEATGSITITASGGLPPYTYDWAGVATTASITGLGAGVYSLTVTDANGCEATGSYVIQEPAPLFISGGVIDISCNGGFIDINPSGGTPPYSFSWSNGSTVQSINPVSPGTYCVTISDANGCEGAECFTIIEAPELIVVIEGLPEDECDTDFTLQAIVTGGPAPYTYIWIAPDGTIVSTNQTFTGSNFINGTYSVVVTDASGCSVEQYIDLNQAIPSILLPNYYLDCENTAWTFNYSGVLTNPEFTAQWVGPNGFVSNEISSTFDMPGEYVLTITNENFPSCSRVKSMTVNSISDNLLDGIIVELFDCNTIVLKAVYPEGYPVDPVSRLWTFPDASTSSAFSISPTVSGTYTLALTYGGVDCTFYFAKYIDVDNQNCSFLDGYIRSDESEDCIADENEIGLQNIIVTATSGSNEFNVITDETGYYYFSLPSDNYTITSGLPTPSWIACEENYSVDLSTPETTVTLNIPLQGIGLCPELSVTLSSWLLRRCFSNNYYLTVCNEGTDVASMAEIAVVLDDYINFNGATITPSSVNGQQINWIIDEIGIGECISITLNVTVSCDAELGQTHCTEAFASSYPFCGSADEWSGANLELVSSCDGNDVVFNIRNTGTGDLNEIVNYIVIEDGVAMMDVGGTLDDLPSGNETGFNFPANGSTYTFMLDQAVNHPYTLSVTNSIEGCGTNTDGNFSTGFVNQFSQQTATPSSTILCQENIGSYDPNDKAAIPVGYGPAHYIEPEDKLNYRIRFQNTGTDTAFTVVVRDTLSDLLDIRTLEPGNSSHDYKLDIFGEKILSFTFNNILLVDSFTNEPASNGFVDFSIRPKGDAPLEDIIENNAAIFFDFNEPVITNTVFHTLGRDFYDIVNWTNLTDVQITLNLFPNPASDKLHLSLGDTPVNNQILRILDVSGKPIFESTFTEPQMLIDIQKWPSNWYAIQLFDTQGQLLGSGKLVKQ